MGKIRFTVGNRILGGFLLLILIFIVNAVIVVVTLNKNDQIIKRSSEVINPSVTKIKDMILLVTRSKMLITNWVYLQSNTADKDDLKELQNIEYPELKDELNGLMERWDDSTQVATLDSVFDDYEQLQEVEQEIMNQLVTFEDYEDPIIKFMAEETIESKVLPQTASLIDRLKQISQEKQREADAADNLILRSSRQLINTTIILGLIISIIGFVSALAVSRSLTRPINSMNNVIKRLGKGELPEEKVKTRYNDEIREMSRDMDNLVNGLKSTSYFAENIGNGEYDADFSPLSENDILGNALLEMRDNLQKVAEEDKKRNWTTTGVAKFGEILRKHTDNLETLTTQLISNLVKYMEANQGGIFIISTEESGEDQYMELAACYAWDKKKYLDTKVYKGEGLAGQSWLEKDTIYVTEVPDDYVKITSGLGKANPTCILIVPLKLNEEIFGVIELASFNEMQKFEIEFVEKIAESIASTISSVKVNARTQKLLEESQELTEQMRAQEEEMRQNMEELQATQEEMQRSQKETEQKERIISNTMMTFDLAEDLSINTVNDVSLQKLGFSKDQIIGRRMADVFQNKGAIKEIMDALQDGNTWHGTVELQSRTGETVKVNMSAGRMQDQDSGTEKILIFGTDAAYSEHA